MILRRIQAKERLFQTYLSEATEEEDNKPPRPDMLRTEHAFLENSLGLKFLRSKNVEGGKADESEWSVELNWAMGKSLGVVFEAPLVFRDPVEESATAGIGDLEIGFRWIIARYAPPSPPDQVAGGSSFCAGLRRSVAPPQLAAQHDGFTAKLVELRRCDVLWRGRRSR